MMAEKLHELAAVMEHVRPHVVFYLGPIPVYSTEVNTWIIMAILFAGVFLLTRRLQFIPRGPQHLLEMVLQFILGLLEETMGRRGGNTFL